MYQSSVRFGELIQQDSRTFHAKISIGEHSITEGIKSITLNGGSNSEDDFSIGSAVSQYVEITMSVPGFRVEGYEFKLEIGMDADGSPEYIPMGYFTAEKPDANEEQISFTAYDRMMKTECPCFLDLPDTTDTVAVLNAISTITGVTVATSGLAKISMQKPIGYTCREVLSYIAQIYGGFAICNRYGQIEIRTYQDNGYTVPTNRYWGSFNHNDVAFLLEKLTCYTGKDSEGNDISISVGSGVREISFSNPFMSQAMMDDIWTSLQNYTYMPGSFKFLGDPRVDPWDILTVEDKNGTSYKVPAMKLTQYFDGGLSTEVEAVGKSESEQSSGFQGPNAKQMDRYYANLVLIEHGLFKKIDADVVEANYVKSARFEGLEADFEETRTRYLEFETATGNDLTLIHGNIQTLEGDFASYKTIVSNEFTATNASITNLSGRYATFEQTVTDELITAKGWMLEGSIGSAQISSVDANKIRSGTIDTALVTIVGSDGRLQISDNTIQISDADRVRVQVGKDASGDYTLAVWDATGNLIWDALGATENTIQRKIIRDKMVADDAAIQALKLDLQSFNTALTNQGVTISGTVVQVGDKTLNVALTEQSQVISEQGETLTDHATRIAANENAISLRVTTQVYESYKATVDSEIASAKSRLSTAESSITALNGQIALKVEQTDIDTAVSGIQVGGRNLLKNSHKTAVEYIYPSSGYVDRCNWVTSIPLNSDTYTLSFWAKSTVNGDKIRTHFYSPSNVTSIKGSQGQSGTASDGQCDFTLTTTLAKYWVTYTIPKGGNSTRNVIVPRLFPGSGSGTIKIQWEKLEEGNKATDWTPAPEDVDASISAVDSKFTNYSTTTQMQSAITAAKDSITQSVSSTYATKASLETANGNITSLTSRVQTAESKLTKDGLTTIVGDYYTTATVVDNKIDGIEIGGRNLIRFSDIDKYGVSYYTRTSGKIISISDGKATIPYGCEYYNAYEKQSVTEPIPSGTTLTGSCYVYENTWDSSSNRRIYIGLKKTDGTWIWPSFKQFGVGETGRISYTITTTSEIVGVTLDIDGRNGTSGQIVVGSYKIETGNKPTDWTPAPEDVDSSIGDVKTTAEQTKNKFEWIVKSGTSDTDFTLTDRTASLVANYINLNGLVTFSGLDSTAQSKINTAQSTADSAKTAAANAQSTADTAKSNAATAQSTANAAKTAASNAQSTADTANSTANTALTNANSAKSWVDSNGSNMTSLLSMVKKWTNNAVSDTTTIQGGWIATNTITADKIAIGDFTNIASGVQVEYASQLGFSTETKDGLSYLKSGTGNYSGIGCITSRTACSGGSIAVFGADELRVNDEFYVSFTGYASASCVVSLYVRYCYTDGSANDNKVNFTLTTTPTAFSGSLKISSGRNTSKTFSHCIMFICKGTESGVYWCMRDLVVRKKSAGNLIVDGAITTDKLAANSVTAAKINTADLFAQNITATGSITGITLNSAVVNSTRGNIGGWEIESGALKSGGDTYDFSGSTIVSPQTSNQITKTGVYLSASAGMARFVNCDSVYNSSLGKYINTVRETRIVGGTTTGYKSTYTLLNASILNVDTSATFSGTTSIKNYDNTGRRPIGSADTDANKVAWISSANNSGTYCIVVNGQYGSTSAYSGKRINVDSSDIRLKENIRPTDVNALSVINQMGLYQFDWKQDGYHQKIGFVADYLEKQDEHLAIGGGYFPDGTMDEKTVNDFYLMGYVIKGMQELSTMATRVDTRLRDVETVAYSARTEVDSLNAKVSSLEYQLQQAYMRIATLEKQLQTYG